MSDKQVSRTEPDTGPVVSSVIIEQGLDGFGGPKVTQTQMRRDGLSV